MKNKIRIENKYVGREPLFHSSIEDFYYPFVRKTKRRRSESFSMLMPGRYTQDTSTQCATINQTVYVPITTTYPSGMSAMTPVRIGDNATYSTEDDAIAISLSPAMYGTGAKISIPHSSVNQVNALDFGVSYISSGASFVAQLFEYNIDDTVLLADALLDRDGEFSLTYSPKGSGILGLSITSRFGPPATSGSITLGGFVTVITGYEAQQVTMTICNEGDDKYRFGFNGQEKTNEIAGVGNHNTAMFWEYDTRLGRRWNKDPKPVIGINDYHVLLNNPIIYTDPLGDKVPVSGSMKEKREFKKELEERTGNKYKYVNGELEIKQKSTSWKSKKESKELSDIVEKAIKSGQSFPMELQSGTNTALFDNFGNSKVFLDDISRLVFPELKAGMLGHIFAERMATDNYSALVEARKSKFFLTSAVATVIMTETFQSVHKIACAAEGEIVCKMLGIPVTPRTETSVGIFSNNYSPPNKYKTTFNYGAIEYFFFTGVKEVGGVLHHEFSSDNILQGPPQSSSPQK